MSDHRSEDDAELLRDLDGGDPGEAPASEEELAAAGRLREALRAAVSPAELDEDVHARLLAAALGGPTSGSLERRGSPPLALADLEDASPAERRDAGRLRDRLEHGLAPDRDAEPDDAIEGLLEVAAALRHAHAPEPLDELAAERLLRRADLGRVQPTPTRRARVLRLAWGLGLAAAAAAAALVVLPRSGVLDGAPPATAALVPARSTEELFDPAEPFARQGGASDRIDRIAAARRADLRQNRFARWGIR
jgi:hypothetical protein